MEKEQKLEMSQRVKVSNKNQINYPNRGIIIAQTTEPGGMKLSKVRFKWVECWYADNDLKGVKETKVEREREGLFFLSKTKRGLRQVRLHCPTCDSAFEADFNIEGTTNVRCGSPVCMEEEEATLDTLERFQKMPGNGEG